MHADTQTQTQTHRVIDWQ